MFYNKQNKETKAGSQEQNEPRLIGSIVEEMLHGRSLLAQTCCEQLHPHTEPCVDLKLLKQKPGRLRVGKCLEGILARDGREHFTFIEEASEMKRAAVVSRNPLVYAGACINVHRRDDGSLYPTFRHPQLSTFYTFRDFCREAAEELLMMAGLGEKNEKLKR